MDPLKERNKLSYSMNSCLHRESESRLNFPSYTILLMEESERSAGGVGLNDGCFVPHFAQDLAPNRHSKGGNHVLADTHARWIIEYDIRDTRRSNRPGPKWPWLNPFRAEEDDMTFDRETRGRCEVALRGP